MTEPVWPEVAEQLREARSLLRLIAGARASFAADPGGPYPADGYVVIESWIRRYFDKFGYFE